jgi:hypothetical protein
MARGFRTYDWVPLRASELENLESERDRDEARRYVYRRLSRDWRYYAVMLLCCGALILVMVPASPYVRPLLPGVGPIPPHVVRMAFWGAIGAVVALAAMWFFRRTCDRHLREYLNRRGVRVCMNCGYNLRALTEHRCPECGESFSSSD